MADATVDVLIQAQFDEFKEAMASANDALVTAVESMKDSIETLADTVERGMDQSSAAMEDASEKFVESSRESAAAAASLGEAITGLKETFMGLLEVWGIFKGVEIFKGWVEQSMELGEKLTNLAYRTGISSDHLQVLDLAAQAHGMTVDRLTMLMVRLTAAASKTSPAIEQALNFFHLHKTDLQDGFKSLEMISDGLNKAGARASEARAMFDRIFGGRFGRMFLPVIEDIREMEKRLKEMNIALTVDQITALDRAQEQWNILGYTWQQLKGILSVQLMPAIDATARVLNGLAVYIANAANQNKFLQSTSDQLADVIIDKFEALTLVASDTWKSIQDNIKEAQGVLEEFEHPIDTVIAKLYSMLTLGYVSFEESFKKVRELDESMPKMPTAPGAAETDEDKEREARHAKIKKSFEDIRAASHKPLPITALTPPPPGAPPPEPPKKGAAEKAAAEAAKVIAENAKVEEEKLAKEQATDAARVAMGLESKAQLVAQETDLAERKFAIQATALKQEAAITALKAPERAALLAQLKELESKHAAEMIGLHVKMAEEMRKEDERRIEDQTKLDVKQLEHRRKVVADAGKLVEDSGIAVAVLTARLEDEEFAKKREGIIKQMSLNATTLEQAEKLNQQLKELDLERADAALEAASRIAEAHKKEVAETEKVWDSAFDEMGSKLDDIFSMLTTKTKNANAEWRKFFADIAKGMIESGIKDLLVGGEKGGIGAAIFGEKGKGGGLASMAASYFGSPGETFAKKLGTEGVPGGILGKIFGLTPLAPDKPIHVIVDNPGFGAPGAPGAPGAVAAGAPGGPGLPGQAPIAGPPSPAASAGTATAGSVGGVTGALQNIVSGIGTMIGKLGPGLGAVVQGVAFVSEALGITNAILTIIQAIEAFNAVNPSILGFRFQEGGHVPGRGPVPAILHGGEFVLSQQMLASMPPAARPNQLAAPPQSSGFLGSISNRGGDLNFAPTIHVAATNAPDIGNAILDHLAHAIRTNDPRITKISRAGFPTGFPR